MWILAFLFPLCFGLEIALFASSGCYSHDVMMRETGDEFSGHNLSWFQARVYEFATPVKLPSEWNKIILNRAEQEGKIVGSKFFAPLNALKFHS
jgi:sialic acid synthase SpsE